jgi:transposase
VDYAGQSVPIVDASTGEITQAQIFVAVLGASNYTYACATASQTAADWVASIIDTLEFIGGVPRLLVPDQPRALIANPDPTSPPHTACSKNWPRTTAGRAARPPGKPRDKPKVEVGVQVVERWILARLRHQTLLQPGRAQPGHAELLVDLNQRPFKKLPGCRRSAFEELDAAGAAAAAGHAHGHARFKPAGQHRLPRRVRGPLLLGAAPAGGRARWSCASRPPRWSAAAQPARGRHARSARAAASPRWPSTCRRRTGRTCSGRRPSSSPGASVSARPPPAVVRWQMEHRPHPEQGYRACLGLMRLAREYGAERLEAACARAQSIRSPTYRSVVHPEAAAWTSAAAGRPHPPAGQHAAARERARAGLLLMATDGHPRPQHT